MDVEEQRLVISPAAILSVAQAVQLLPIRDVEARAWLRERGLIRDLCGRQVVVWGMVVAEISRQEPSLTGKSRNPRSRDVPTYRVSLD